MRICVDYMPCEFCAKSQLGAETHQLSQKNQNKFWERYFSPIPHQKAFAFDFFPMNGEHGALLE